jgi:hypothetical protein
MLQTRQRRTVRGCIYSDRWPHQRVSPSRLVGEKGAMGFGVAGQCSRNRCLARTRRTRLRRPLQRAPAAPRLAARGARTVRWRSTGEPRSSPRPPRRLGRAHTRVRGRSVMDSEFSHPSRPLHRPSDRFPAPRAYQHLRSGSKECPGDRLQKSVKRRILRTQGTSKTDLCFGGPSCDQRVVVNAVRPIDMVGSNPIDKRVGPDERRFVIPNLNFGSTISKRNQKGHLRKGTS